MPLLRWSDRPARTTMEKLTHVNGRKLMVLLIAALALVAAGCEATTRTRPAVMRRCGRRHRDERRRLERRHDGRHDRDVGRRRPRRLSEECQVQGISAARPVAERRHSRSRRGRRSSTRSPTRSQGSGRLPRRGELRRDRRGPEVDLTSGATDPEVDRKLCRSSVSRSTRPRCGRPRRISRRARENC